MHNWTPRTEQLVMQWRDSAAKDASELETEALTLHRWQRVITLPQLVLGGIVGSLGFAGVSSLIYGVLGVIMAALVAVDTALQLGVRANEKSATVVQLRTITTQIDVQLARERSRRDEAQGFVDKLVVQIGPRSFLRPASSSVNNVHNSFFPANHPDQHILHHPVVNCMMMIPPPPTTGSRSIVLAPSPPSISNNKQEQV
jgi:hypothetical protein